ncbi:DUF7139 domain-containing protein [Halorubrum sp. DTA98]|uniref:DUF7139 domain-containing protein n=1 Tax=Halorubrum sp. DTA98 TaxID=3402163 RepID=UPI003AAB9095
MTSLSETYGGRGRSEVDSRRLYLGVALFAGGTLLLVVGILTAAEVLASGTYSSGEARLYGGILGGLGVPLVMLGVMTVLPADRTTRAAAVVGAAVMALGVALFAHAYPYQWVGGPRPELTDLTLPTAGIYFLGAATTFWCLFVGVANFKTRNDPGGTVTMEVTHKGETKVIEVERDRLGDLGGGVGLLGSTPDGDVKTQTNRPQTGGGSDESTPDRSDSAVPSRSSRSSVGGSSALGGSTGVSDGGSATKSISSPLGGESGAADGPRTATSPTADRRTSPRNGPGDTYCGNCTRFDYVRTDEGMQPYCGHYDELMDDMDACEEWTPR